MKFKVAFLFDKNNDWIFNFYKKYNLYLDNFLIDYFFDYEEIKDFDIVFILGYTRILPTQFLRRNRLNLVVHESDLPKGKGFSPIQWQLLEGKSEIKITLIEVTSKVDSGDIFLQKKLEFKGTELYDEIREIQAKGTFSIIHEFLEHYPNIKQKKQVGTESFYPRRTKDDGELDISKTIEENFNLMRIGNNKSWPSFFYYKGNKFIINIFKDGS
tara:strand:- start:16 stop:657 length:642 start_codon:yes stop_codon:yes gene_type:complete